MRGRLKQSVAASVILYNPTGTVRENVLSYINDVHRLYVLDNSREVNTDLLTYFDPRKVEYIYNGCNVGVARALNVAIGRAITDGYQYLFTFDQDSHASASMIRNMIEFIEKTDCSKIGVISAFHNNKGYKKPDQVKLVNERLCIATSGNILNLRVAEMAGGFDEKLFIDYVDIEYCLRINSLGYRVIELNNAVLEHNLGQLEEKKLFGKKIAVTHHSAERLYFRTRNRLHVSRRYFRCFKRYCLRVLVLIGKDVIKICLFEKNRLSKMGLMAKGIFDFKRNRFGNPFRDGNGC
ncbi:MAG: glycosyltransferase [Thermodesulfobacteriota bacterium]|nr:glycosyltransferase [Thermodesulfobacteriota bacterium]